MLIGHAHCGVAELGQVAQFVRVEVAAVLVRGAGGGSACDFLGERVELVGDPGYERGNPLARLAQQVRCLQRLPEVVGHLADRLVHG